MKVNRTKRRIMSMIDYFLRLEAVDYRLIVSVLFLLTFGLIMIYSASNADNAMVFKQLFIGIVGLVCMVFLSFFDYHWFTKHSLMLFLIALGSLFLVKVPGLGVSSNGASRWIDLKIITFQPSELMKPAIVFLMTYLVIYLGRSLTTIRATAFCLGLGAFAAFPIYKVTENLSTAIIVFLLVCGMFFVAYPQKKIWILVIAAILLVIGLGYYYYNNVLLMMNEIYQPAGENASISFRVLRLLAWIYPEADKYSDVSMQSRYSLYAIGFGGILGRGLGCGTVKYYLPEPTNDFIFAVIAEELGLVGCLAVMFLFVYQIWRIFTIAQHAKDKVGNYIALGIGLHVAIQTILNIGVATNTLPNTGISLPYISYGGSALLIQLCEIGIILNISRQIPGKKVLVQGSSSHGQKETRERKSA